MPFDKVYLLRRAYRIIREQETLIDALILVNTEQAERLRKLQPRRDKQGRFR